MFELALSLLLAGAPCEISAEETTQLLALDWEAFDQGEDGFRQFASETQFCPRETAELIEKYLEAHPELTEKQRRLSGWHAGQLFANADDPKRALPHFYRGFNPDEDPESDNRWNAYVRASIAFLENDRATLDASAAVLEARKDNRMNAINLGVVKRLQIAFGKTYREAMQTPLPQE